ncbi:hypothetical protein PROPEN_02059 [Proteus penneri ATCC 35198]|nr:hypothetical protein PROPEN_02059 [Proteus penneri ATCC 35198]
MSSGHLDAEYLDKTLSDMDGINTSVCLLVCCEATNNAQESKLKEISKTKGKYIFILNNNAIDGILDEYLKVGEQHFNVLRCKFNELN